MHTEDNMSWFAWVALTEYLIGNLKSTFFFFFSPQSSGDLKFKIRVQHGWLLVRALFLTCSFLPVSSQGEETQRSDCFLFL